MNPNPDPLEKFIAGAVKDLPLRKAPGGLETRVLAEIARRQALPWWKKSWAHWPSAVRWAFLIFSAALSAAMIAACISFVRDGSFQALLATVQKPVASAVQLWSAVRALTALVEGYVSQIPSLWLYGAIGAIALTYATLIGLGATAYRLLWHSR